MNSSFLLTVAIPTYNRPETLEKIILQLKEQSRQDFNILISDDKSPDNGTTQAMVTKHQKTMSNLFFNRNEENLGYSGNVCKLYELVQTKYVWFICDDDTVLPNSIEIILENLDKYKPVVSIFNHTQLNPYNQFVEAGPTTDRLYTDIKALNDYQPLMRTTFLSIVVVEKRLPVEVIKQTNYKDNVFFQITLSLLLLSDNFRLCEIAKPILHRNVGYKYGEFFKFYLIDHLKAVFLINHKFDNSKFLAWSKKQVCTAFKLYMSQKLGLFVYKGNPTSETINLLKHYYGPYSWIIFMFRPIYAIIPAILIKFFYFVMLINIHGYDKARIIYKDNINRAFSDSRQTGFTTYR